MRVKITQRDLDEWARTWPCSTLETGWAEFSNGDLVDLGGRLARTDVDGHEFNAFIESKCGTSRPTDGGTVTP